MDKNDSTGGPKPGQVTEEKSSLKGLELSKRLLLPLLGFVILIFVGLYIKNKVAPPSSSQDINPESFQGPAEVSGVVQQECVSIAARILKNSDCAEAESEFFASLDACKSVGISEASEGIYPDLSFKVAQCYFESKNDGPSAARVLEKVQTEVGEWEVFEGPVSCSSKNIIAAKSEAYLETRKLSCGPENFQALLESLKKKEFASLKSFLAPGATVTQGFVDSDANCPDAVSEVFKNMEKLTMTGTFEVKEASDSSNPEAPAADSDRYVEFSNADKKIMMLQFRKTEGDCFQFSALLVKASEDLSGD